MGRLIKISYRHYDKCYCSNKETESLFTEAIQFDLFGREYLIYVPGCRLASRRSQSSGSIKLLMTFIEDIFHIEIIHERELTDIIRKYLPSYSMEYEYKLPRLYSSSYTKYYNRYEIEEIIKKDEYRCPYCFKPYQQWNYDTKERGWIYEEYYGFCSAECIDSKANDREEYIKQKEKEKKWIKISREKLKEVRKYLRNRQRATPGVLQ